MNNPLKEVNPPGYILVGDTRLEDALRIIRGYCSKHIDCDGCKFDMDNECYMMNATYPPCDWEFPWELDPQIGKTEQK